MKLLCSAAPLQDKVFSVSIVLSVAAILPPWLSLILLDVVVYNIVVRLPLLVILLDKLAEQWRCMVG